jgi:ubiquinone/menaquinone biosynthesis C-methylase UbiE
MMEPSSERAPTLDAETAVVRQGWNDEDRVANFVRIMTRGKFAEPVVRRAWLDTLRKAIPDRQPLDVLDAGCGPGTCALLYAELGHTVTGLDLSDAMVREARAEATLRKSAATFRQGDAQELPFPDASFDVVSSRFVIFTLPRPGKAIREWLRVLRPGGTLLIFNANRTRSTEERSLKESLGAVLHKARRALPRRKKNDSVVQWSEYERVVTSFPLFYHDSGMVRALMDAAGAVDITNLDATDIQAARMEVAERHPWVKDYKPMEIVSARKR